MGHQVRTIAYIFAVSLFVLVAMHRATAGTEECQDAIDSFHSSRSDVFDALKAYASCVSSSDGTDDCSNERSTLSGDQDDFESAVSAYQGDCGN
jgi:hypothetical protein